MAAPADSHDLPAALEGRLYDVWFDGDPGSRPGRLDALCRDNPRHAAALRARADVLTRSDDLFGRVREQLEAPAPSERIGHFVIHRVLGQGGFGTVYLAEQQEPVRRTVALKVLRPGRVDARALSRFEGERHALARLQHANIARIFDAGVTAEGLHYFAMEFVDGKPVTTWCDAAGMDVDARLRVFAAVCAAIQHAHQRGVVHRDVKPSNVLVFDEDGRPRPKVIDFGVAKLLAAEDTDGPALTREGAQVGTPGYMSPEQANGEPVDTRSDVYALGVLLCELMTGQLPFPRDRLRGGSAAMARMLAEEDPARPSELLHAGASGAADVARRRGTSAVALRRRLRTDLDWVVLKAIARRPDDRYPSVAALADDVERHLRREPVSVRERVASYWLRKFVARHRLGVGIAASALVAVVVAIAGLAWALDVVDAARREAVDQGDEASRQRDAAVASSYAASMTAAQLAMQTGDVRTALAHLDAADPASRGWEWRHLAADVEHASKAVAVEALLMDVAWIDDDRFLGFEDYGAIGVWSVGSGEREHTLADWSGTYRANALDRDRGAVAIANDRTVGLWSYLDGRHQRDVLTVDRNVTAIAWSPSRRLIAAGSKPEGTSLYGRVDVVAVDGGSGAAGPWAFDAGVTALAFVGDDELVVGFADGTIRRVDATSGETRAELRGHSDWIDDLLVDGAHDRLYSASVDTAVGVWDLSTGRLRAMLPGQMRMRALALSPDGLTVYANGGWDDCRVQAWDTRTLQLVGRFHGHRSGSTGMALDPKGERLLTSSRDMTWRLWAAQPPQSRRRLAAGRDARSLSASPDGARFAAAAQDGTITVWHAHTLDVALCIEAEERWAGSAIGRDRVYVAGGSSVAAFAIADGRRLAEGPTGDRYVERLAIDPAERWLVGGHGDRVLVWSLPTLELQHVLELSCGTGRALHDPESGRFVVGSAESTLRWLDPGTGAIDRTLRLAEEDVIVGGLARREDLFVAGLFLGQLRWRRGDGPLQALRTSTIGAAISPDGTRLATAGSDHAVRLWDTRTMRELLVLGDLVYGPTDVYFVDGGRRLVALAHRWDAPSYVYVWTAPDEVPRQR